MRIALIACALGLLAPSARVAGQTGVTTINLVEQDPFVLRSLQIVRKSGGPVPSVKTIQGIDTAAGVLRIGDVFGKTVEIPLSEIDRIDCVQRPQRHAPMAQEPPWTIEVFTGAPFKGPRQEEWYSTPRLEVANGILTVPGLPPPVAPPATVPKGMALGGQEMTWEVRTIRYDAASKAFHVVLLPTRYEKRYQTSGGGTSGVVKGLP